MFISDMYNICLGVGIVICMLNLCILMFCFSIELHVQCGLCLCGSLIFEAP